MNAGKLTKKNIKLYQNLGYKKFKEKGILSTLTFPTVTTAIFFLFSLEGPFDGDAIFAAFGYGNLILNQMASILINNAEVLIHTICKKR